MQLTPYIMFNGNCEEALNFYVKAFDGEIKNLMRFEGSAAEPGSADRHTWLKCAHHFLVCAHDVYSLRRLRHT